MKTKTEQEIDNLSKELNKVQTADEITQILNKINDFAENKISQIISSGKAEYAEDFLEEVACLFEQARAKVLNDKKLSQLRSFADFFSSTAEAWRKRKEDTKRRIVEELKEKAIQYIDIGEHEKSYRYLDEAIKIDSKNPVAWFERGNAFFDQGLLDEAIRAYQKSLEIDPTNSYAMANLGSALNKLNQFDESVEYFERALGINPTDENALLGLADAYFRLERFEDAKATADQALALNAKSIAANLMMGSVLHDGFCEFKGAKKYELIALELDKASNIAKANYAETLLAFEDCEKTEELSNQVLKAGIAQYGFPMRLVRTCSLYFNNKIEEATISAHDLLDYYIALQEKTQVVWIFRGLEKIIIRKKVPYDIKIILFSFIDLASNQKDELTKKIIVDALPEKIKLLQDRASKEKLLTNHKPIEKDMSPEELEKKIENKTKEIYIYNTSRPDRRIKGWYYWEVFLGPKSALRDVKLVEYTLHETFPIPVVTIADYKSRFKLKSKGWGEFQIKAEIFFKNTKKSLTKYHWLKLGPTPLDR